MAVRAAVGTARHAAGFVLLAACAGSRAPAPPPTVGDAAVARERTTAAAAAADGRVRTLGITPFAVAPGDTALEPLAYAFADLLTTDLARSARLTLVERARLGDVLRELDLAATGRVDSATAPRVGRLLQAGQLVVGSLGALGARGVAGAPAGLAPDGQIRLGAGLADVRTGAVVQAVDASAPVRDVLAAEKALAFRLFDALGVTLTPAERAAVEQRPTANLAALLAYGRGVRHQVRGEYRAARGEFRRAARLDRLFRTAVERAEQVRTLAEIGTTVPLVVPGLRPIDGAVINAVDRLNRPLDGITARARPGTAADPSFPLTTTTVVLVITRP